MTEMQAFLVLNALPNIGPITLNRLLAALGGDPRAVLSATARQLESVQGVGPVIAATDYVRAVPESVRAYVPAGRRYRALGTDGFGRSDTRAALRAYFGVDAASIAQAARAALAGG